MSRIKVINHVEKDQNYHFMDEQLISSRNIRNFKGCQQIIIKKGMLITPSAKDIARDLGINVFYEEEVSKYPSKDLLQTRDSNPKDEEIISNSSLVSSSGDLSDFENKIEAIVKDVLSSRTIIPIDKKSEDIQDEIVVMINFHRNDEIMRGIIKFLIEKDITIKDLHSYISSGLQFINMVCRSSCTMQELLIIKETIKDKFNVKILID